MDRKMKWNKYGIILLFGSVAGMAWGLASLIIGFSPNYASSSGPARMLLSTIALPFSSVMWLGTRLDFNVVHPTRFIIAAGTLGGFAFTLGVLVFYHFLEKVRNPFGESDFRGPLP